MIKFFMTFANIASYLAIAASLAFYIGILVRSKNLSSIDTYNNCHSQLKSCRVSSITFVILAWFLVSGGTRSEAISGYISISNTCYKLGSTWIVFAFINIVFSLLFAATKRSGDVLGIMKKLRSSSFVMGTWFLFLSFILQVN